MAVSVVGLGSTLGSLWLLEQVCVCVSEFRALSLVELTPECSPCCPIQGGGCSGVAFPTSRTVDGRKLKAYFFPVVRAWIRKELLSGARGRLPSLLLSSLPSCLSRWVGSTQCSIRVLPVPWRSCKALTGEQQLKQREKHLLSVVRSFGPGCASAGNSAGQARLLVPVGRWKGRIWALFEVRTEPGAQVALLPSLQWHSAVL